MYSAAMSSPRDGVPRPSRRSEARNATWPRSESAEIRSSASRAAGGTAAASGSSPLRARAVNVPSTRGTPTRIELRIRIPPPGLLFAWATHAAPRVLYQLGGARDTRRASGDGPISPPARSREPHEQDQGADGHEEAGDLVGVQGLAEGHGPDAGEQEDHR